MSKSKSLLIAVGKVADNDVAENLKTNMKILVAYSGGKDSQASLLWAVKKYGAANIEAGVRSAMQP